MRSAGPLCREAPGSQHGALQCAYAACVAPKWLVCCTWQEAGSRLRPAAGRAHKRAGGCRESGVICRQQRAPHAGCSQVGGSAFTWAALPRPADLLTRALPRVPPSARLRAWAERHGSGAVFKPARRARRPGVAPRLADQMARAWRTRGLTRRAAACVNSTTCTLQAKEGRGNVSQRRVVHILYASLGCVALRQCMEVGRHYCSVALWRVALLRACMLCTEPGARHAQAAQGAAVARRRQRSPARRRARQERAGARGRRARRGGRARAAGGGGRAGAGQRRGAERKGRGPRAPQPCVTADPEELAEARAGACQQQRCGACAGCGGKPWLLTAPDVLTAAPGARPRQLATCTSQRARSRRMAGTFLAAAWGGATGGTAGCALALGGCPGLGQRCLRCQGGVWGFCMPGVGQPGESGRQAEAGQAAAQSAAVAEVRRPAASTCTCLCTCTR